MLRDPVGRQLWQGGMKHMLSSWLLPTLLIAFKVVGVHNPYLVLLSIIKVDFPPHWVKMEKELLW